MNTYEGALSRVMGINVRRRRIKRILAWVLLIAALVTPVAFNNALIDFGQRRAEMTIKWILSPATSAIQHNFEEQMRNAQLQARVESLRQTNQPKTEG